MDWYVEGGGNYIINGEKVWGRNVLVTLDEVESKIRNRFRNTDAFATIYMYDSRDQNTANLFAPLYIDLDLKMKGNNDYQKVKQDLLHVITTLYTSYGVPFEYIRVFFSGNKGFHVLVDPEIFGIEPRTDLNEIYRSIAHDIKKMTMFKTVDTGIYDRVRLFRLANSLHSNTGLYKVPVSIDFVRSSNFESMVEYASSPKEIEYPEPRFIYDASIKFNNRLQHHLESETAVSISSGNRKYLSNGKIMPCIQLMLETPAASGTRNNSTVIMASALCQSGWAEEDALAELLRWNKEYNVPSLSDREMRKTVASAFKGFEQGRTYGCRAIKDLDMCVPQHCSIAKKR